jgi:hypothetical protein
VSLNNGAGFIVSAGGGGDIAITARNINMNNGFLTAGYKALKYTGSPVRMNP